MIPTLIILLIFGGSFGSNSIDLTDPVVLAEFWQHVLEIVRDPAKATNVTDAVYRLNILASQANSTGGVVEQGVESFRAVAGNYTATPGELRDALLELETALSTVNRGTIGEREVIRQNTTKREWKKLIKKLGN
jgi:hypothetical protein